MQQLLLLSLLLLLLLLLLVVVVVSVLAAAACPADCENSSPFASSFSVSCASALYGDVPRHRNEKETRSEG